jgi:hypothetical protein
MSKVCSVEIIPIFFNANICRFIARRELLTEMTYKNDQLLSQDNLFATMLLHGTFFSVETMLKKGAVEISLEQ